MQLRSITHYIIASLSFLPFAFWTCRTDLRMAENGYHIQRVAISHCSSSRHADIRGKPTFPMHLDSHRSNFAFSKTIYPSELQIKLKYLQEYQQAQLNHPKDACGRNSRNVPKRPHVVFASKIKNTEPRNQFCGMPENTRVKTYGSREYNIL